MRRRALGALAGALGDAAADPIDASGRIAELSSLCGYTRLSELGVSGDHLPEVAAAVLQHPARHNTPDPPGEAELLGLLRAAL